MGNNQAAFKRAPQVEAKMRKTLLDVVVVLAIAAFPVQMAIAAPRSAPKAARVSRPVAHQFRNAFGSVPKTVDNKSCDIIWCYEN